MMSTANLQDKARALSRAARAQTQVEGGEHSVASLLQELDARRIRYESPPPKPEQVFKLCGQRICTPGNISVLSAQAKGGKSGVLGALLASAVVAQTQVHIWSDEVIDLLGFESANPTGKAVIVFDTEQAPFDAWRLVEKTMKRAQLDKLPDNFRCFALSDVSTDNRREMLAAELGRAAKECGGIHAVLVDGVADLCVDPNDPSESFGLVEELIHLAVKHHCPILSILHENPNSGGQGGKTRGHLGSQLERKAESNLKIAKATNGVSVLYAESCRAAHLPREQGVSFRWDDAESMHITVAVDPQAKREEQRGNYEDAVKRAFEGQKPELNYSDLVGRIMKLEGKAEPTAKKWVRNWRELGLVIQDSQSGSYRKV